MFFSDLQVVRRTHVATRFLNDIGIEELDVGSNSGLAALLGEHAERKREGRFLVCELLNAIDGVGADAAEPLLGQQARLLLQARV